MNILKKLSLLMLLVMFSITSNAQSKIISDIDSYQTRNSGEIMSEDGLKGYYFFYKTDKVDRKNNAYKLVIFDENLVQVGVKELISSKYTYLKGARFNGDALLLRFYDSKETTYDFKVFDMNAKQKFTVSQELSKKDLAYADALGLNSMPTLSAVEGKGFISSQVVKNKKPGYELSFISDQSASKGWKYNSDPSSTAFETALMLGNSSDQVVLLTSKTAKKVTTSHVLGLDVDSGKKMFEVEFSDDKYDLYVLDANVDQSTKTTAVLGQYYTKGDKVNKKPSLGLFSFVLDDKGNIKERNFASWANDMSKFVDVNEKGRLKNLGHIFFHEVVKTNEGKYIAVGETYKQVVDGAASALSIAAKLAAAASGGSVTSSGNSVQLKIVVEDLLFFEFDENFKLTNVNLYDKTKSNYTIVDAYIPSPASRYAGLAIKYGLGAFDYNYSQSNRDNSVITFTYTDFEKVDGAKKKPVFHAITYADGEVSEDEIKLERTFKNKSYVFPAKTGHVTMYEYDRKEKKIEIHTEKLNY